MSSEPSMQYAKITQIRVPGYTLRIKYPTNSFDPDLPRSIPPDDLNFTYSEAFRNHSHVPLARLPFAWKGFFWQGVYGTLQFNFGVKRRKIGEEFGFQEIEWLMEQCRRWAGSDKESLRLTQIQVGGIAAIQGDVDLPIEGGLLPSGALGHGKSRYVLIPLGQDHAVSLDFGWLANDRRVSDKSWRQKSINLAEEIVRAIEIVRVP